MKLIKTVAGISAASLLTAAPAFSQLNLVDPDAIKPVSPPVAPRAVDPDAVKPVTPTHPHPLTPSPPVYHPPVYHPPTPVVPVTPVYPPTTGWYSRSVYISGYGTRYVEYRTLSSGLRTIKVWGPKGKEKLKDVNCWNNTFRAPKNKNPFRFQYETVKAVCRY